MKTQVTKRNILPKALLLKTKKKTYLLLVVVLGVWGMIGYRIWAGLNPEAPKMVQQDVNINFNPNTGTAIDTFSIQTIARDPFLGTLTTKKKLTNTVKKRE